LLFDGHNLKAGLVDFGQNGPGETLADCVRLDDAEGALRHESVLLDGGFFVCPPIVMAAVCGGYEREGKSSGQKQAKSHEEGVNNPQFASPLRG
jgi:hypothetical protein